MGGTLAFMAPEQLVGEPGQIGPRADVFALGGVLFFLLTGQPPRRLSQETQVAFRQVLTGLLDETALQRAPAPSRIKAICRRALSADPQMRQESAEALACELEACCSRRGPLKAGALAAAGVAVVGLAVWGAVTVWPPVVPTPSPVDPTKLHQGLVKASVPALIDHDIPTAVFDELVRTDLTSTFERKETTTGILYVLDGTSMVRFDPAGRRVTFATLLDVASLAVANDWNEAAANSRVYCTPQGTVLEIPLLLTGGVPRAALKDRYEQLAIDARVFRYHLREALTLEDVDAIVEKDLFKSVPTRTRDAFGTYIYSVNASDDRIAYYAASKTLLFYTMFDSLDAGLEAMNSWNELRLYSRAYRNRSEAMVLEVPLSIADLPPRLGRDAIVKSYRDFTAERIAFREQFVKSDKK